MRCHFEIIEAVSLGHREQKKQAVRDRLVAVALARFVELGFDAVSVAQIAEEAGISRRTFFRYFSAKEELLFDETPQRLTDFVAALAPLRPDEALLAPVRRACRGIAAVHMEHRKVQLLRRQALEASATLMRREHELDREYQRAIEAALLRRYRRPNKQLRRHAAIVASAIFGAMRATLDDWFSNGAKADLVALAESGMNFFESGLALPAPERGARPRATTSTKGRSRGRK